MSVISAVMSLKDNVSPSLSKIEKQAIANLNAYKQLEGEAKQLAKQMKELASNGLEDTAMYRGLESAAYKNVEAMAELADGTKNANMNFKDTTAAVDPLTNSLLKLAKAYIGIQGARKLINLSDTYTQSHARLGLITKDVDTLEKQIYQSAQRARVSTKSLTDTVAKLGMQAGEAFKDASGEVDTKQILAFTENLNKVFTISGMDANSIGSVMYNMTQSLSTGRLLGQDYRILKQNAPMVIKYLREFYGNITQAELDAMVSAGKVTAQDLKNAMFKASDDIEEKFGKMPVTFEQAWTKFTNTIQRMLIPVLKVLTVFAGWLDKIFTFLSEHQYILYLFAALIGLITARMVTLNIATAINAVVTKLAGNSAAVASLKFALLAAVILAVVGIILYLWNTNDKAAEAMIKTWDAFVVGLKMMIIGLADLAAKVLSFFGLTGLQDWVNDQKIKLEKEIIEREETRADRVANRKKIGYEKSIAEDLGNISSLITNDSTGGSALKTTSSDNLLKEEDIQLLLDVATRDFKLNYQQITPQIAVTFGDVHENADVDVIMDKIADAIDEVWEKDLEVVSLGT